MQRGHGPPKERTEADSAGIAFANGLGHFGRAVGKGVKNAGAKASPKAAANGHANGSRGAGHSNGSGNGVSRVDGHGVAHANLHGNAHATGTRPGDVARDLISALWERSVPLISNRLHGLDVACEAAVIGRLSPIMRRGAADTAHKLAGSLGMFGYPRGTDLAREIEQLLENDGVVDPVVLRELVVELRACLPL